MYRTDFWTLWEKARVGCFERTASKHVYYLWWNRSPAQVGCMRQVLGPGALGRPRGMGWRGRWEGGSGWGIHVNPWLTHVNVWQNPLQYCKVISLQLIKINEKKKLCPVCRTHSHPTLHWSTGLLLPQPCHQTVRPRESRTVSAGLILSLHFPNAYHGAWHTVGTQELSVEFGLGSHSANPSQHWFQRPPLPRAPQQFLPPAPGWLTNLPPGLQNPPEPRPCRSDA